MNKNKKFNLSIDFESDDEFNKTIEEMIKPRIVEYVRSEFDKLVCDTVENCFNKHSDNGSFDSIIMKYVKNELYNYMISDKIKSLIVDAIVKYATESPLFKNCFDDGVERVINRRIGFEPINGKIITAIIDAVKNDKEDK